MSWNPANLDMLETRRWSRRATWVASLALVILIATFVVGVLVMDANNRRAARAHAACQAAQGMKPGLSYVDDPCFGVTTWPTPLP